MNTETETNKGVTCAIHKETPTKIEPTLKRMVRRVKEQFKPTHCRIRFDIDKGMWAVLDNKNEPLRHFAYGFMTNVKFSHAEGTYGRGCGGMSIGIAEGDLVSNSYGSEVSGFSNLSFNGSEFKNEAGVKLEKASVLRLMSDRRAVYKP